MLISMLWSKFVVWGGVLPCFVGEEMVGFMSVYGPDLPLPRPSPAFPRARPDVMLFLVMHYNCILVLYFASFCLVDFVSGVSGRVGAF